MQNSFAIHARMNHAGARMNHAGAFFARLFWEVYFVFKDFNASLSQGNLQ